MEETRKFISNNAIWLWVFILLKFTIQYFLVHPDFDLHRDEYLHLDLAKHLAWGYTSVPPVTSWISYVIGLLGNGLFWVKFFPALFGALLMLTVWKITEALNGSLYARILAATAVTFSVIFRINTLYQPNSLEYLCWALLFYALIKYVNSGHQKWLWALAVVFALGFLNKYSIAFLALAMVPAMLLTEHRTLLVKKQFLLAVLLAILLISPNLYWQYQHGFPVFTHMKELQRTQLVNVNRLDFLKDQLLFFFPAFFVLLAGIIALLINKAFSTYRFILYAAIFTLALFTYFQAKSYYAIGLHPVFMAFGAVYLDRLLRQPWTIYVRAAALTLPPLLFFLTIRIVYPIDKPETMVNNQALYKKYGMLRWEDGKDHHMPQDFADMLGWKELAEKVDRVYAAIPEKENILVICDNYGLAGAINYYSKHKNMAAVSFNADYKYWFDLSKEITTVITVKTDHNEDAANEEEHNLFEHVTFKGKVENPYAREHGTVIYLLEKPKMSINTFIADNLDKK
ncbi:glycosyltransferase family 39 protein [Pedobacter sp.]|uniref:glycosyltransferase family 39 protein n=1 Tax=Pedobacter sp. TaxID=1411316 RepID=UPI003D7F409D